MKFGMRKPSINKMIGARKARITRISKSWMPLYGRGAYTTPKKKLYNKVYRAVTFNFKGK